MGPFRRRHLLPRALSPWLFWLALLLPLAQTAAVWHAYGHVGSSAGERADRDPKARVVAHCDLCLIAAAAAAGGSPSVPPVLPPSPARHAAPLAAPAGVVAAAPTPAYLGRAPPFVPRSS